ncbi:hypothetical protein Tco_1281943 [Tanacetum coccineum]
MWIFSRGVVLLILLMLGIGYLEPTEYEVRKLAREFKGLRCDQKFSRDIIVLLNDNGTSQSKKKFQSSSTTSTSRGKYCILLSMVCVKYSALVRRIVADFLHVPPNRYSSRPNDMKQYRSSSILCSWLLLLLLYFSSNVLLLLLFL